MWWDLPRCICPRTARWWDWHHQPICCAGGWFPTEGKWGFEAGGFLVVPAVSIPHHVDIDILYYIYIHIFSSYTWQPDGRSLYLLWTAGWVHKSFCESSAQVADIRNVFALELRCQEKSRSTLIDECVSFMHRITSGFVSIGWGVVNCLTTYCFFS